MAEKHIRLDIRTFTKTSGNAATTKDLSAKLPFLLGEHHGLSIDGAKTTLSVRHFPPRVRVEDPVHGQIDLLLPKDRNGATVEGRHRSKNTLATIIFPGFEIAHKLKPTK